VAAVAVAIFTDMMGMGMGGMADMLKNMGGMGGGAAAGANPFEGMGGGGGMGGMGDTMGKAQEAMKNPKVRELLAKAQSNPKIMKAMTEVMSNPMAFAKYQNDPECAELSRNYKIYGEPRRGWMSLTRLYSCFTNRLLYKY
jgi:hypothetical protein